MFFKLAPCGGYSVDTTPYYLEILRFRCFYDHFVFVVEGAKIRNKVLKKYFQVSVVVDLECVDTKDHEITDWDF